MPTLEDFEKEFEHKIMGEGLLSDKDKFGIMKFLKLNAKKLEAAVSLYSELEDVRKKGEYDHAKQPLIIAAEVTGLSPKVLAYELQSRGLSENSLLESAIQYEYNEKVGTLQDFLYDAVAANKGQITFNISTDKKTVKYRLL